MKILTKHKKYEKNTISEKTLVFPCMICNRYNSTWLDKGSDITESSIRLCLRELSLELDGEGDWTRGLDVCGCVCSRGVGATTASFVCEQIFLSKNVCMFLYFER
jgi:hypothetical protein